MDLLGRRLCIISSCFELFVLYSFAVAGLRSHGPAYFVSSPMGVTRSGGLTLFFFFLVSALGL